MDFLPEEYNSDDLTQDDTHPKTLKEQHVLSSSTQALLAKLTDVRGAADEILVPKETKIIFCSRTHSQLTQFVRELRRVKPPASIVSLDEKDIDKSLTPNEEVVKHLCLGSRKNLCINQKVSQLGSVAAINERCLDLQKPGVPEGQKCGFLPRKENEQLVDSFRDHVLAEIHDLEDLSDLGGSMGICPYYAARTAIESTEILTLPYPLLLQKSAREALGVSVTDHVVIIDEAHNLMDAISETYSCSISLSQIELATSQVMVYIQKFKNRLKGKNRMYLTQIVRLLNSISDCLCSMASNTHENEATITPSQLMAGKGVDQIQPHKLISYLQKSKLARKVEDYVRDADEKAKGGTIKPTSRGALQLFQSFIAVLMNPSAEGRFFFSRDEFSGVHIRYTLLDPREHFQDIVEEARAVILAGGTMSPMSDYRDYLFSYLPPDRLRTFSFGHVVPSENIFAQFFSVGPSGVEFDFTFAKRKSEEMLIELGMLFMRVCNVIPDGVIAFFPSYDFLSQVISVWKRVPVPSHVVNLDISSTKASSTIFSALNAVKPIFHESKPNPHQQASGQNQSKISEITLHEASLVPPIQESLLQSYTRTIDQTSTAVTTNLDNKLHSSNNSARRGGALLLSVISGSLSEGINFSDSLGRAVIAVGLPYPNPHSAIWKAKLQHVEETYLKQHLNTANKSNPPHIPSNPSMTPPTTPASAGAKAKAKSAAREFYENTTLRSINQAIGRAIRHKNDYAAILLVDRRWESERLRRKLPGWIRGVMENENRARGPGNAGGAGKKPWEEVEQGLKTFFDGKN